MLVTVDPTNIDFLNYTKGPEFKGIFDVFKDVIFDDAVWKNLRNRKFRSSTGRRVTKVSSESHEK
ncbi:hypothetical protein YC2023_025304 [Brassica napus]